MPHVRQQIRDRLVADLTGLPTSGNRIYPAKRTPWDHTAGQLPGIALYTDTETAVPADKAGRHLRTLTLVVECAARGDDRGAEDSLDTLCAEVEAAIAAIGGLDGLVQQVSLVRTAPPPEDVDIGDATAAKRLEYSVRYATSETDAQAVA
ncbi:hypothetical protein [Oleisolibacter albus]|uniref:hypothetical protein n=1 Tax=Oleisolibacter albus TaxID=2171757 RepID=UPI000DF1F00E|nr:hypothetical protein [Oleisolibacter albus]